MSTPKLLFVSYQFSSHIDGEGFGYCTLVEEPPINNSKRLQIIQKGIEESLVKKGYHEPQIVILNFRRLED